MLAINLIYQFILWTDNQMKNSNISIPSKLMLPLIKVISDFLYLEFLVRKVASVFPKLR